MMGEQISRGLAEQALARVERQFAAYIGSGGARPTLSEPGFQTSGWSIDWEEGPFEWTYRAFHGGFDMEIYELALAEAGPDMARELATDSGIACPAGVFSEPVNHWCLGLYPA